MENIFSIDTEDWPQLMCSYLGHQTPVSDQFALSTERALDLLDAFDARATFFVVAPHAESARGIIKKIAERGHEVATHGWSHSKLATFTPMTFAEDLRRSLDTIEQIIGEKVRGYRAPFFSLLPEQSWAFSVMLDCGLDYDSSLTTLLWQRAGIPLPDGPFLCELPDGREILEAPALAVKVGPITGRLIGGRTLRVLPRSVWRRHMQERAESNLPAMVYVHSYEITPDRLMRYVPPGLSLRDRARLLVSAKAFELGMGGMEKSLKELLSAYAWTTMGDAVDQLRERDDLPRVKLTTDGKVNVLSEVAKGDESRET